MSFKTAEVVPEIPEYFDAQTMVFKTKELYTVAHIAADLISKWGMVAAAEDGDDSAGRQKVRLQNTQELVTRACGTAQLLWEEMDRRGWIFDIPVPKVKEK